MRTISGSPNSSIPKPIHNALDCFVRWMAVLSTAAVITFDFVLKHLSTYARNISIKIPKCFVLVVWFMLMHIQLPLLVCLQIKVNLPDQFVLIIREFSNFGSQE